MNAEIIESAPLSPNEIEKETLNDHQKPTSSVSSSASETYGFESIMKKLWNLFPKKEGSYAELKAMVGLSFGSGKFFSLGFECWRLHSFVFK